MPQRSRHGGARKTQRPRAKVDAARRAAYDVIHAVSVRDAYANLALAATLRERGLSGKDAAFATELASGTLRRRGSYDAVLTRCVQRPLRKLDAEVLDVLRMGAHQLLGMRVPAHAAVATSVDLARSVAGVSVTSFVNAVLRKVAARDVDEWLAEIAPAYDTDPVGHLAVVHAHPPWIVQAFQEALGGSLDETAALLAADNEPASVTLAARPGRSTVEELIDAGARRGRWSPYAAVLESGDPYAIPAVAEGRAGVQDEGSQLVTNALAAVTIEGRDSFWLDMCAGPGGKAALLASLAADRSAGLVAGDVAPHRAALTARALRAQDGRWVPGALGTVVADGRAGPWRSGAFDRVLLDAPCTGLGALRRRPESRWRRTPEEPAELQRLQIELCHKALDAVRVGGVVAYVTCSPHLAETRDVVTAVLESRDDVVRVDARPYLPGVPELGEGPDVQLWPHRHGTDAMYLALLKRAA
ncbi:MAG TPA: transcription antitermination factor NusB [Actinopolymorphaceae bacterium]